MTQPEALRLADEMERVAEYDHQVQAAAELRRLYELNQELLELLKLADAALSGSNINMNALERKVRAVLGELK